MRKKITAICLLLAMNAVLCSCSKPQSESVSAVSAGSDMTTSAEGDSSVPVESDTAASAEGDSTVPEESDSAASTGSESEKDGTAEADDSSGVTGEMIDGLPVFEIQSPPYIPDPDKNPGEPGEYLEYNGEQYWYNHINLSENKYNDEVNAISLFEAASCAGQKQITEYSQWYDYVAGLEQIGFVKCYYYPNDGDVDTCYEGYSKLYSADGKCLIEEFFPENGDKVYYIWGGWDGYGF